MQVGYSRRGNMMGHGSWKLAELAEMQEVGMPREKLRREAVVRLCSLLYFT